ncbi:glycosyltransferase family 32 protein [Irpex rosettiformis]|uniref:Glycosyltransferase family 32 protein n=1 Tax=Irpex rosettiformis TaxID=378272 RepID=A0ACB8U970_9APHY|nr:glycosyltransferase family 32 protein [Irpex rosettiformis]
MASAAYLGGSAGKELFDNDLPTYNSAVQEKRKSYLLSSPESWLVFLSIAVPGTRNTRFKLPVLNFYRLQHSSSRRFGRRRGTAIFLLGILCFLYFVFASHRRFAHGDKSWPTPFPDPSTLVYKREHLQRIWEWEVAAGHYPSRHKLPEEIGLQQAIDNPALPVETSYSSTTRFRRPISTDTIGIGPKREYLDFHAIPPNVAYPRRPAPGSVADMDVIMKHCDFSENKYVRDCLEVLRYGGGLELGVRVRRTMLDKWRYIYVEGGMKNLTDIPSRSKPFSFKIHNMIDAADELPKKRGVEWETRLRLPLPPPYVPYRDQASVCDDENPRIFHMFWTGPFTDKPYLALLSFLFTQNLGLDREAGHSDLNVCRPKFWLWINPGPAASVPNTAAVHDMYNELKSNPWASPFLHPRFKDVIQFKLWNTTEQLDGVPELKDEWRALRDSLFNSGGYIEKIPQPQANEDADIEVTEAPRENGPDIIPPAPSPTKAKNSDDKANRVGSTSASTYDRLSVILSDMARFVLCHRFGGIYLDADTIFLRDWEELWGWRGAFAYRWSRLPRYNTAVLRMNRNSALGTFIFRTALKNGLDFHPMSVSQYTEDAYLEGLLLRLPDALFDSAWLNTENYQRDRPPQPYFTEFGDFFNTPTQDSAAPQALGFDGFFRGAYSYHFHNFWWQPFDPTRNFPDLGPRFAAGERNARESPGKASPTGLPGAGSEHTEADKRDLDWATVLKRTFEAHIRGERPNMYGEWIRW